MLPSLAVLEQIRTKIKTIPNRRKESKRKIHYGCYLLCSQAGLRISEAVRFDLNGKTRKGLYLITKTKGKKERLVYISKEVIRELKKANWQPNQTNRFNFYHFLRKIKRELNISTEIELTPHNLRRTFATYHAEAGIPLPLLQKLLGHSSIRTTALYWKDIYSDDDDSSDILAGKKWLETKFGDKQRPEPSQSKGLPTFPPITENFPQSPRNFNSITAKDKPVISNKKPIQQDNSLLTVKSKKTLTITNYQPQPVIKQISPKTPEKFLLDNFNKKNHQLEISQPIALAVTANQEPKPTKKELILLQKIKQLEEQLAKVQSENNHLKLENKHLKLLIRKDQATEAKILHLLSFK